MADDKQRLLDEIEGVKEDALKSTTGVQLDYTTDELLRLTDLAATSPEDKLLKTIEGELAGNALQYFNTFKAYNGNERLAAQHILDFMIEGLKHDRHWPMVKFMAHFDGICRAVVER